MPFTHCIAAESIEIHPSPQTLLEAHGLRATPCRVNVLDVLIAADKTPVTSQGLKHALFRRGALKIIGNLHRTLRELCYVGLVTRTDTPQGAAAYGISSVA